MDEKIVKDSQGLAKELVNDTISRQAAIRWVKTECNPYGKPTLDYESGKRVMKHLEQMPSAQPECAKDFVMLKVIDLNGRPYYSIIYLENGNEFEGYSSYDLKVISEYLKRYFGSAQPERKKGRWIERNPQNSDKCRLIECDQCGFSHIVGFNVPYEHWIENRNFCERCGADMRCEDDDIPIEYFESGGK